jgi:hypothetical protein
MSTRTSMNINWILPKWEDSWPKNADPYGRVWQPITRDFMSAVGDRVFKISKNEDMPAAYRTGIKAYIRPGNELVYDTHGYCGVYPCRSS